MRVFLPAGNDLHLGRARDLENIIVCSICCEAAALQKPFLSLGDILLVYLVRVVDFLCAVASYATTRLRGDALSEGVGGCQLFFGCRLHLPIY